MKKIKICFIARSAYPLFNKECKATFGGSEVDLYLIATNLAKDPMYEVDFVLGDFSQDNIEHRQNVRVIKSYDIKSNKMFQIMVLLKKLIFSNSDIYFQQNASGGTFFIALLAKILGKKFIYRTASDIDCNGQFIRDNPLEGFLYKCGIRMASTVVTQNYSNQRQLKQNFNIDAIVVKNALNLTEINLDLKKTILWVARSEKLKQPGIFLDLADKFPNNKFVMICPSANNNSVDMNLLQERVKNIKNVEFIDYVTYHDIFTYFDDAKLFVNTSTYEGFPNTFAQALCASVPIVSLNVNPDNFLSEYNCGFCAGGDLTLMLSEVESLISGRDYWNEKSANARKYAENNLDMAKAIVKYKEIFYNLIYE
jgi:glycosyltransferase involved in cell wall biosynthesis